MIKSSFSLATIAIILLSSQQVLAKEIPVQGRFFIGSTSVDPKNVNESVVPQGIKKN